MQPQPTAPTQPPAPDPARPRERVLWNTAAIIIARILSDVFNVLASLKMARHLGKHTFGLLGYLITSMEIFRVLTSFGLDVVTIRTMAVGSHHPRSVTRQLLALKTALCAAGFGAVAAISFLVPRLAENRLLVLVLGAGLFAVAYGGSLTVRFQAEHLMDRLIPVQFIGGALYLAAVYLVASRGYRLGGMIGVVVGLQLLNCLLIGAMAWRTWRRDADAPRGLDWSLARTILRQGLPVGLLGLIVVLYSRLSVFLLERFGDLGAVGYYYIAMKVSEPLLAIAGALSTSAFPVLSRLVEQGRTDVLKRRFLTYSTRSVLLSCGVAVVVTLFGASVLELVKPEFRAASGALVALAWATVFMFQNQLSTTVINSHSKYHWVTGFAVLNLCVFLGVSLTLIPRYGATGAGLSTLVTEGINTGVQLVAVTLLVRRASRSGS